MEHPDYAAERAAFIDRLVEPSRTAADLEDGACPFCGLGHDRGQSCEDYRREVAS